MTKDEFKKRWEGDENGGGITMDDIAECAKAWGVSERPKMMPMDVIRYRVLVAANTSDAAEFEPSYED